MVISVVAVCAPLVFLKGLSQVALPAAPSRLLYARAPEIPALTDVLLLHDVAGASWRCR
jgi:hypothetical protein